MSFPTSDDAFLYKLERNVRAELTEVETSRTEDALAPIDEWIFDPADAQREEAGQTPRRPARRQPHRAARAVTGAVDTAAHRSLAVRDLLRGGTTGLPSGEAVAQFVGAAPLTSDELEQAWPHGTPLWFYILKEAEHRGGGDRLGPVCGRIVAEVLIGLLRADPASYLSLEPDWEPILPAAGARFGLTDLLTLQRHALCV
ncbi:hypothetical protein AB0H83_18430 [Dactylosporangium sp. NPDC050688]|uniref:hypothetical protein n=1 Tax=Dactylosporangium sp. NPDC050688 TaxID=3157217 RepID=UPI0034096531